MNASDARVAILGDIHANLEALEAVIADARGAGCTQFACVGDIVGYNANPVECIALVRELNMFCVRGNHDESAVIDGPLAGWSGRAQAAMQWTRKQLSDLDRDWLRALRYIRNVAGFTLVHATLDAPERWGYVFDRFAAAASFCYQNTALCFFGHTHLPMAFVRNRLAAGTYSRFKVEAGHQYFLNVGSVGEPRDGNPMAAYVVYSPSEGIVELRRVPYDVARTEAKLCDLGLPLRRR